MFKYADNTNNIGSSISVSKYADIINESGKDKKLKIFKYTLKFFGQDVLIVATNKEEADHLFTKKYSIIDFSCPSNKDYLWEELDNKDIIHFPFKRHSLRAKTVEQILKLKSVEKGSSIKGDFSVVKKKNCIDITSMIV